MKKQIHLDSFSHSLIYTNARIHSLGLFRPDFSENGVLAIIAAFSTGKQENFNQTPARVLGQEKHVPMFQHQDLGVNLATKRLDLPCPTQAPLVVSPTSAPKPDKMPVGTLRGARDRQKRAFQKDSFSKTLKAHTSSIKMAFGNFYRLLCPVSRCFSWTQNWTEESQNRTWLSQFGRPSGENIQENRLVPQMPKKQKKYLYTVLDADIFSNPIWKAYGKNLNNLSKHKVENEKSVEFKFRKRYSTF